jgi:E3 ubiquitin-protein ligase HUWE1
MLDLVSASSQEKVESIPPEASEVNFSFYRKTGDGTDSTKDSNEATTSSSEPRQTPARKEQVELSSGPVTVHLGPLALSSRSAMEILNETVKSYQVPESERYELMCRIRMARALGSGRSEDRQKLMVARLLAIAIFAHSHNEAQAQASLFLYETDLIAQLASLLQLDRGVPVIVQTAAIAAMDAIARYRNKILEVLAAINAGVNHGIAMSLLRKTVTEVANPESTLPHIFVDALLSFVIYLASHTSGGSMVVSAGLVPLLIQIISITLPQRLAVVSKTMQLVDNVLYSFTNAFQMFCNGHGVEVLTERIKVCHPTLRSFLSG